MILIQSVQFIAIYKDGYYKYPYIFEIGWSVQENNNIFYITKTLTLDTGEQLTIYFI